MQLMSSFNQVVSATNTSILDFLRIDPRGLVAFKPLAGWRRELP
jgi:hypothetical protein